MTISALARASKRAAFHLLQAAIEGLKAVEAFIDELAAVADEEGDPGLELERIEVE